MTYKQIINFIGTLNVHKKKLKIFLKNHYPEIYNDIVNQTLFLDKARPNCEITFAERIYCLENEIYSPVICPICNKNVLKFKTDICQYTKSCSISCSRRNPDTMRKVNETLAKKDDPYNTKKSKQTRIERYGQDYAKIFSEKTRKTKIERYGSESYNNQEKRKQTCIERYGYDHYMKNNELKEKYIEHFKEIHNGKSCAFQLDSVRKKTNLGIRNKSYEYAIKYKYAKLVTPQQDFMSIPDIEDDFALEFKCKFCGTIFKSGWNNGIARPCPNCCPVKHGTSKMEKELYDFLSELSTIKHINFFNKMHENRKLIPPREIDIIAEFDNKKLAIEFNGLYWHSVEYRSKNSQIEKTEACEKLGVQLINIFEDEWISKQEIVKARLKNLLGVYDMTVFARKCEIREIDSKTSKLFQENNHIQGPVNASINIGLFYKNEMISLMTFGKCRFDKKHEWEMLRFCNKLGYHIPGAASKLLKYFERNYQPKSLVSYADRRWSRGDLYKALGFSFIRNSIPNYWYFKNHNTAVRYSRINFQKHKLKNKLEKFDPNKSEIENMKDNKYNRIYDCGNMVFVKEYTK